MINIANSVTTYKQRLVAENELLQAKIELNNQLEPSRLLNLAACESVSQAIIDIVDKTSNIDHKCAKSLAIVNVTKETRMTDNPAGVEFSLMCYLKYDKDHYIKFTDRQILTMEKALQRFSPKVEVSKFGHKLYVTVIFDRHYSTPVYTVFEMANTSNVDHPNYLAAFEVYTDDKLCYVDSPAANHKRFTVEMGKFVCEASSPSEALLLYKKQKQHVSL